MPEKQVNKKLLFVDDEKQILRSLNRLFMDTEYEVFIADSGACALEILANEKIDLLVTDMRMPVMDGVELLERVKSLYPNVLRIILSGYSEKNTILTALQKNLAKLYIMKPWDNDALLAVIDHIFETEGILSDQKLLQLINTMDELPALKNTYHEIMRLLDQGAEIGKIAIAIEKDPAIATKILHIINSAFYEVKTGNIKQAITLLGLSTTKNIVLATSVIDAFAMKGAYSAQLEVLWKHSFICSQILNIIYEKFLHKKLAEIESAAGILHNIGRALLLKIFREKYSVVFDQENKPVDLLKVEIENVAVTHQQVGAYLLKWWEIPYPIVEVALYHHTPFFPGIVNKELVCAVHLSQYYASILLEQAWGDFDERVFDALKIKRNELEKIIFFMIDKNKI